MLHFKIIASGSKGNAYLLKSGENMLMLECGIKFKELQKALNFNLSSVDACLLTHEHNDHSHSVKELIKRGIDIYCSQGTAEALGLSGHRVHIVKPLKQFNICDNWTVVPFDTIHDAREPLGFLISDKKGHKLLFATDTAYIKYKFEGLTHIAIECNHDREILKENAENGSINLTVAKRIMKNHMSIQALEKYLSQYDLSKIKVYYLHQSEQNI